MTKTEKLTSKEKQDAAYRQIMENTPREWIVLAGEPGGQVAIGKTVYNPQVVNSFKDKHLIILQPLWLGEYPDVSSFGLFPGDPPRLNIHATFLYEVKPETKLFCRYKIALGEPVKGRANEAQIKELPE